MRTLHSSRPATGLRRDLALLWRIGGMLVQYLTEGTRLRQEYRRRQFKGEVYWVDGSGPTRHREEPLRQP